MVFQARGLNSASIHRPRQGYIKNRANGKAAGSALFGAGSRGVGRQMTYRAAAIRTVGG